MSDYCMCCDTNNSYIAHHLDADAGLIDLLREEASGERPKMTAEEALATFEHLGLTRCTAGDMQRYLDEARETLTHEV